MTHEQKRKLRQEVIDKARAGTTLIDLVVQYPFFSYEYIKCFCRSAGIKFKDPPIEKLVASGFPAAQPAAHVPSHWDDVDWRMRDTDIGVRLGVSRERVRQIRRKLGKQNSVHHHRHSKAIVFLAWAKEHKEHLQGLTAQEISELSDANGITPGGITKLLPEIGIYPKVHKAITLEEIIEQKKVDPNTGCWHCNLPPLHNGHIRMPGTGTYHPDEEWRTKPVKYVRNLVFEKLKDSYVPKDMILLNDCGDITCINPEHQRIGTFEERCQTRRNPGQVSEKELQYMLELYEQGKGVMEIAAATGRPLQTINKVVSRRALPLAAARKLQIANYIKNNPGCSIWKVQANLREIPSMQICVNIIQGCASGEFVRINKMIYPAKQVVHAAAEEPQMAVQ